MRDLSAYAAQCMRELDRLHIRYAQNITFAVNTRAKTRLGVCKKQGDRYTVEIAAPLLDESMPEKLLKDGRRSPSASTPPTATKSRAQPKKTGCRRDWCSSRATVLSVRAAAPSMTATSARR